MDPKKQSPYSKGLGLHYARLMCEMHGGQIEYNDAVENQHEFQIKLPKKK